jgi:glycosidase
MPKIIIYQVFPRYFGNTGKNIPNGSIEENGCGKFGDFTPQALNSIADLGCTHIWFTGVLEHATQTDYTAFGIEKDHPAVVKGKAGSPYAIKDYYDVDPDLAIDPVNRRQEFFELVERTHQRGLKVIIDFVPNHVARHYFSDAKPEGVRDFGADDREYHGFNPDNNYYYILDQPFSPQLDLYAGCAEPYREFPAKATGNDCFTASPNVYDWYETVKLNYGIDYQGNGETHFYPIPTTWFKMLDILNFWSDLGVDGFRCDMAEMVPVEFWGWVVPRVKKNHPELIFVAEVYQPNLYEIFIKHGQFDVLYDKEGMYNTIRAVVESRKPASAITESWQRVNSIHSNMLQFLENHDEQRIASDFFAGDPFKAFPAMFVLTLHHDSPILIYAGQELGETGMYTEGFSGREGRSTIFDYWSVDSLVAWKNNGRWDEERLSEQQRRIRDFYRCLFHFCHHEKAVREGIFFDLEYANLENPGFNPSSLFAFLRKADNEMLLGLANFSDLEIRTNLIIPKHAFDCLEIPDGQTFLMKDLFSGIEQTMYWSSSETLSLSVPAYGTGLYKCVIE